MSIIEKALDKLESKGDARREREPLEGQARRQQRPGQPASTPVAGEEVAGGSARQVDTNIADNLSSAPAKSPAVTASTRAPAALVDEQWKDDGKRPEFPRKTLKHLALDFERLEDSGIITPETKNKALLEQFRIIKRPLLRNAAAGNINRLPNGNLLLVTSAIPGEGKTYTAINLAMSIATELDHTVLLVDADPDKGDVSRMLGIHETEGLMDFVAQPERALSELLVKTDMDKLTVLPSGASRSNNTELLASDDMSRLADELARRYDDRIVILDSPPLLATSGASVLAHLVGQTVMVVEAIRTPQSALLEALAMLKPIQNVGLVLNKSRDGDGSGFQYGAYGGYGSKKP